MWAEPLLSKRLQIAQKVNVNGSIHIHNKAESQPGNICVKDIITT